MSDISNMQEAVRRLEECQAKHPNCGNQASPNLPRRVIHVGESNLEEIGGFTRPRLHFTSEKDRRQYTALSYCWGKEPQVITTMDTIDAFQKEFKLNAVSQSIQDAITVTRKLGIQYLWVDALCIIQDNSEDNITEIKGMGKIYKNATLTLAALNSDSSYHGFLRSKSPFQGCPIPFCLPDGSVEDVLLVPVEESPFTFDKWPLESRVWAFQEHLLSRRILSFGDSVVYWKRREHETGPLFNEPTWHGTETPYPRLPLEVFNKELALSQNISLLESKVRDQQEIWKTFNKDVSLSEHIYMLESRRGDPAFVWDFESPESYLRWYNSSRFENKTLEKEDLWKNIVEIFSKKELSLADDRQPAISGIASELQSIWGDVYLAGMWRGFLLEHLAWSAGAFGDDEPVNAPYLAPRWSWIPAQRGVRLIDYQRTPQLQVIGCSVEPREQNVEFSQIRGGKLTLCAVTISHISVHSRGMDIKMDHAWCVPVNNIVYMPLATMTKDRSLCLGLIMKQELSGEYTTNTYRRVGLFECDSRFFEAEMEKGETKELIII